MKIEGNYAISKFSLDDAEKIEELRRNSIEHAKMCAEGVDSVLPLPRMPASVAIDLKNPQNIQALRNTFAGLEQEFGASLQPSIAVTYFKNDKGEFEPINLCTTFKHGNRTIAGPVFISVAHDFLTSDRYRDHFFKDCLIEAIIQSAKHWFNNIIIEIPWNEKKKAPLNALLLYFMPHYVCRVITESGSCNIFQEEIKAEKELIEAIQRDPRYKQNASFTAAEFFIFLKECGVNVPSELETQMFSIFRKMLSASEGAFSRIGRELRRTSKNVIYSIGGYRPVSVYNYRPIPEELIPIIDRVGECWNENFRRINPGAYNQEPAIDRIINNELSAVRMVAEDIQGVRQDELAEISQALSSRLKEPNCFI